MLMSMSMHEWVDRGSFAWHDMGAMADSNQIPLRTNLNDHDLPVPDVLGLPQGYLPLAFRGTDRFLEAHLLSVINEGSRCLSAGLVRPRYYHSENASPAAWGSTSVNMLERDRLVYRNV